MFGLLRWGAMGSLSYHEDEPIAAIAVNEDDSGKETFGVSFDVGKVRVNFDNEPEVPLEGTNYKLLIELMGKGKGGERPGVDIVMVLDVSESVAGEKFEEMKRATQFVISKLSPFDRLSIITFSSGSERKCQLCQMTPKAQVEIRIDFYIL